MRQVQRQIERLVVAVHLIGVVAFFGKGHIAAMVQTVANIVGAFDMIVLGEERFSGAIGLLNQIQIDPMADDVEKSDLARSAAHFVSRFADQTVIVAAKRRNIYDRERTHRLSPHILNSPTPQDTLSEFQILLKFYT